MDSVECRLRNRVNDPYVGARGQRLLRLLRLRGERLERPTAHLYETGGMRRVHLRGHTNVLERLLTIRAVSIWGCSRLLIGVGTPRGLQGRHVAILGVLLTLIREYWQLLMRHRPLLPLSATRERVSIAQAAVVHVGALKPGLTTGC